MNDPRPAWTRRDSLAALALFLLPFGLFQSLLGLVGPRRYLAEGDFTDQFLAFGDFAVRELAAGRLPLWNPYAYGGAPFWADIQSAVAYPPNLLLYLGAARLWGRLPFLALELSVLLHLGLAAAFTYAFARRHLGDRGGALLAAVAFGLGGYLTGYPMLQPAILQAVAWLPLLFWAQDRSAAAGEDPRPVGAPARLRLGAFRPDPWQALALAMVLLAGHAQTALHIGLLGLVHAWWLGRPEGGAGSPKPERGLAAILSRLARPPLLRYLGSGLLALLLAAPGWLPALDYMRRSTRASADYAMLSGGFPPGELLGLLLPGLTHWSPLYLGLLPLLLALAALARWLEPSDTDGSAAARPPGLWPGLVGVALLLSLGRHAFAFDLFYLLVPGFRLFRGQERAAVAVSFGLALLAGWALARWRQGDGGLGRRIARGGAGAAALGVLLALVASDALRPAALRLALLGLAAAALAQARAARRLQAAGLAILCGLLAATDLRLAVGGVNLQAAAPAELRGGAVVAALRQGDVQRVENLYRLPPNFGVLHGVEALSGASPLRLAHMDRLLRGLEDRPDLRWDLLAVSHVLTWQERLDLPAETLLREGEGEGRTYLQRLAAAAPWLWWVPTAIPAADDDDALRRLRAEDFPRHGAVIVQAFGDGAAPPVGLPAAAGADATGGLPPGQAADLALLERHPGHLKARSQSPSAGWLVFSEAYDPGWRAWVDGRPTPLLRANLALMALALPPGEHEVRLRYTAPWLWFGLAAWLLGALFWAMLVVRARRSRRGHGDLGRV